MVSLKDVLWLVNMMRLFLIDFSSVLFSMNDRHGVINFGNWLLMNLDVLFGRLFVSYIYGRIVVLNLNLLGLFWLFDVNMRSLFWLFNVILLFMMDFDIMLLGGLLVVGLGNLSQF